MTTEAKEAVCSEIQKIVAEYNRQEAEGNVDTPGGLEHMGDVWRLLFKWDKALSEPQESPDTESSLA